MMDQQTAPRLRADLFLLHAPSVCDFRERDDMLFCLQAPIREARDRFLIEHKSGPEDV